MKSNSNLIGEAIDRVEGKDKVTGRARYCADHAFSELVYAMIVQSESAHGTVSSCSVERSTTSVLAAPGVLHVLSPLN